ncbi:hypothetical protein BC826DRAFT_1035472 [Russula brevipes]|nr:hypothetical protein BC826DRAFT_1035472 [Russula brevipes]
MSRFHAVSVRTVDRLSVGQVTLNILPNDVLLEIFEIHTVNASISPWRPLVHVCRRWRHVVFASTRRLNVQLWSRTRLL